MNILSRDMEVLRDEGRDQAQACAGWETTARIACAGNRTACSAGRSQAVSSRNPPKGDPMRNSSGISGLQAGEDVNSATFPLGP